MQANKRKVWSAWGMAGSGKTVWARRMVERYTRVVIVDGGFTDEEDFPGIRALTYWEFHAYMLKNIDGLFRVRFSPTREEFPLVCRMVREAGDCLFVVDESDRYNAGGKVDKELMELIARGRHWGIDMLFVAGTPMQIHIDIRNQSTHLIIFNTSEPAYVEWIAKVIGTEWAAKVPQLPPLHGIEYVKGAGCTEFALVVVGE